MSTAPSSTLMRMVETSPVTEPSLRISTRSAAINISVHLAHDYNFAGGDVGLHAAVASNGDAIVWQADLAFDAAIDIKRFRTADFALDDESTANGGLLDGRADGLDWI